MRKILIAFALLAMSVGCKNTVGPGQNRTRPGPDPLLSIDEQKKYGRERYSYIEDSTLVPRGFADRPSPTGR